MMEESQRECANKPRSSARHLCSFSRLFLSELPPCPHFPHLSVLTALALAMGRDNVSGGVANLVVVTEAGVERVVVPGDKLPKFHDE